MSNHTNVLQVLCPDNNHSERIYIIKLLLEDYLDKKCVISFENKISDYILKFDNKRIVIEDHFFYQYTEELSYLALNNIPDTYSMLTSKSLPIIYGRDYLEKNEYEIHCGVDIFASSFFLLTRWEEYVIPKGKDGLRCEENDLFLIKHNLYQRPLVNEYLELLRGLFSHFDIEVKPQRKYRIFQTHDVDWIYLSSFIDLINNLRKLAVNQKLFKKAIFTFFRYLYYRFTATNPFDSFNDFMQFSDKFGLKNSFYFKMCDNKEIGATYAYNDKRTKKAIEDIVKKGHHVGFHPSENCTNDPAQFRLELNRLLNITQNAKGGRQHLLIYQANTLKTWSDNNLEYDSGYGFQFHNGFRCGICYEFSVFDVFRRKTLNLMEMPFVLMDTVFLRRQNTTQEMLEESKHIIDVVKKHNGTFCSVWHTNLFKTLERKKHMNTYFEIIEYAVNE